MLYIPLTDGERFDECALGRGCSLSLSAFDGLSGSPLEYVVRWSCCAPLPVVTGAWRAVAGIPLPGCIASNELTVLTSVGRRRSQCARSAGLDRGA